MGIATCCLHQALVFAVLNSDCQHLQSTHSVGIKHMQSRHSLGKREAHIDSLLVLGVGAAKAGYAGFMVTVDAPRLGNRVADERNK